MAALVRVFFCMACLSLFVQGGFVYAASREVTMPLDFIKTSAGEIAEAGHAVSAARSGRHVGQIPRICEGDQSQNFDCYEAYYQKLVRRKGVKRAFADLRLQYVQNSYVVSQCHPLTHVIGRIATKMYRDVGEAYTHGDSFCWSGYYHGVLEGVIGKIGRRHLGERLNRICASLPGKTQYTFDYYNCVHGLGHGVMAYMQDELFDALALCDKLDGSWERESCYSGVFMENVIVDNKNHLTKYLKPTEPLYPCNAVEERYKASCYLMQTSYMLKITSGDFKKVFGYCGQAEPAFRATCYQSVGRDASGRSVSDIVTTKATCEIGESLEARTNCVVGAVKDIMSYFHSDIEAARFCASVAEDVREPCRRAEEEYKIPLHL